MNGLQELGGGGQKKMNMGDKRNLCNGTVLYLTMVVVTQISTCNKTT